MRIASIVFGAVTISATLFYWTRIEPVSPHAQSPGMTWDARIVSLGADAAYEEMIESVRSIDPDAGHLEAHRFGDALYTTRGLLSFDVCDARLLYGCVHAFVSRAIAEHGEDAFAYLYEKCARNHACEHGLGHGLVAYFGYEREGVNRAIAACTVPGSVAAFDGCLSGVFMEYYLRPMLDDEELRDAQILDEHATAACDEFDRSVRSVCWFWRAQLIWERHQRSGEGSDLATRIREACASARAEERIFCIGGAGRVAVSSGGYSSAAVVGLCETLAVTRGELIACVGTGAQTIGGSVSHEAGRAVCDAGFRGEERDECHVYLESPGFGEVIFAL